MSVCELAAVCKLAVVCGRSCAWQWFVGLCGCCYVADVEGMRLMLTVGSTCSEAREPMLLHEL